MVDQQVYCYPFLLLFKASHPIKSLINQNNYKLNNAHLSNNDFDPVEVDQEGGLSSLDIKSYCQLKPPSKRANPKSSSPSTNWQRIFFTGAIILILGIVFYYIQAEILIADRSRSSNFEEKLKEKETAITQLQRIKNDLEDRIASLINQLNQKLKKQVKPQFISSSTDSQKIISKTNVDNPNAIIDIAYASKDYGPLPINPLRRNAEGKRIEDVLYKDEPTRKKRIEFMEQRADFVNSKSNFPSIFLAKYNLVNSQEQLKKAIEENERDWLRLQAKFQLSKLKEELPMCVVVPGYNNNANFRIEYNLNSIFTQNYTNYKVAVINDASTDDGAEVYRNFFSFYAIDKQRYTYIENSKRVTALQNIYLASINHCSKDSIVVTLDADDEFIGRNVLQVLNWAYQTKKAGVVYSNFYWFQQPQTLRYGFTSEYSQNEKKGNLFRSTPMKFSQLRSFRAQLVHLINPKDLQDQKGVFFTIAYDMALFFPLMELSCTRVNKIQGEFHYLYNVGTGLNDYQDRGRQVSVDNRVRGQKKYECYKQFDERMKK